MRLFLLLWSGFWTMGLPLVLAYLFRRAHKDVLYREHLSERFGLYRTYAPGCIWIHAVSLGEVRSAVPLAHAFLARDEKVVFTTFTPAGRREAEREFEQECKLGKVHVIWVPLETSWAFRGFFHTFRPKFGLVMEIEIWPRMVFDSSAEGVALFMCNAQYPSRAMQRDNRGLRLRQEVMRGFAGAFVKSDLHARRFSDVGVRNIAVTGEMRFEQPVPCTQVAAGKRVRKELDLNGRTVVAFVSTVEGEDEIYLCAMRSLLAKEAPPFFVYVPRKPERFGDTEALLAESGFATLRRSVCLPPSLDETVRLVVPDARPDVLVGDSLGEMYFYITLADIVVVGGGFTPGGAHNIIEPLALRKPVITGPETGTTEYPFVEAEAAGVAKKVEDAKMLAAEISNGARPLVAQVEAFFAEHSGSLMRFFEALPVQLHNAARGSSHID